MAAIAIAGATAVREIVGGDDDGGAGGQKLQSIDRVSSVRAGAGDAGFAHDGEVATWRIRYRVASPGTVETEDVTVRAPFDSHTEVTGAGGKVTEVRETSLGVAATKPVSGTAVVLAPAPEAAGFRPGPVIAGAVERGLLVRREQRTVAKRRCQVYRTSADLGGLTFARAASGDDYVDVCVDADGLLLELVESYKGSYIRQRVAVSVDTGVDVSDADVRTLPVDQTIPPAEGGGSIRPIDPASRPVGRFFDLDGPPAGFARQGRYEVIPPQPDIARPDTRGRVVAATSDVFVRGADVVVVERGARLDQSPPWELDDRFPDVDLGPLLGTGEVLAGATGGEVRVLLGAGRFVRVYGTVPLDDLVTIARSLRETAGGTGPVYLDGR